MHDLVTSNQKLQGFRLRSTGVLDCAGQLRELGYRVCAMEDTGRRRQLRAAEVAELGNVTLAEVLDAIVAANPGYVWEQAADLLNIFPQPSILDEKTPAVHVRQKGLWQILREDIRIESKGITILTEMDHEGPLLDVDLEPADVRHALNAVVAQLPKTFWQISGTEGAFFLTLSD